VSSELDTAKSQARAIGAALNGSSSAMQQIGNIERDGNADRMLAVALAHAMNAIGSLITAVENLERTSRR
jgi:hypothetical protein